LKKKQASVITRKSKDGSYVEMMLGLTELSRQKSFCFSFYEIDVSWILQLVRLKGSE